MISFVRINDPLRLIPVFILFVLLRILFISNGVQPTALEIYWLALGEKLNTGVTMYVDIWDNTPPFAAFVYWLLAKFGNLLIIHRSFAGILVMFQAYTFNAILLKKNIHRERSYLPAFLYVLLMLTCFDFLTLSPLLISMTFLMLLLKNIFGLNEGAKDEDIFNIGIYLGLAILAYLPNWIFIFFVLLCITFFRTATFRQYMLFIYGLAITLTIFILLYGWQAGFEGILTNYFLTLFTFNFSKSYVSLQGMLPIVGLFAFFLFISIFKTYIERSFINYQRLCQLIMILWFIVNSIIFFMNPHIAPIEFIAFVPVIAFFVTYFFLIIKREWLSEVFFLVFLAGVLGVGYYSVQMMPNYQTQYLPNEKNSYAAIKGKKIVVFGENMLPYQYNTLTTPYTNWGLAQRHFNNLNQYQVLIDLYKNLQKDLPEVIIDEKQFTPSLFNSIPILKRLYQQDVNNKQIFWLIENKQGKNK